MASEIPTGWRWTRIGEQFERVRRRNSAGIDRVLTASGSEGLVDQREFFTRRVAASNADHYYLLKRGEFAYNRSSMTGYPFGAIKRLDRYEEGALSTLYICFALQGSTDVDSDFVAYLFDSEQLDGELGSICAVGARAHGLLNVTPADFFEVSLLLPPLPEQRRIAGILSSVDDAIAATRKVIEQTKRVKQGLLQTLMTRGIGHTRFKKTEVGEIPEEWSLLRLDEVARVQTGFAKNSRIEGPLRDFPYLRVANVQDGHLDLGDVKTVGVPEGKAERYLLMPGDVLLTEGGDYDKLGRGHIWEGQISPCVHQNHVFAVRADRSKLLPEFLSALTSSSYGKRYFLRCAKQTTNLASINSTQLRSFPVLLPSLSEQTEIVRRIRSVDAVRDTSAKETERLTRFKRGLMNDLLTGRVRVPLD